MIRCMSPCDIPSVIRIWNICAGRETPYKIANRENIGEWIFDNPAYDPSLAFVNSEAGRVNGFIIASEKKEFLRGETRESTPGYITMFAVEPTARGRGVAADLLSRAEAALAAAGKTRVKTTDMNPLNLPWLVPGEGGHDHNNAPGCDVDCPGYSFLLSRGYRDSYRECAMYLNLKNYSWSDDIDAIRAKLKSEGIETGRYDPRLLYDFDLMCDHVGSEYWRRVLQDETAKPNPRPILAATTGGRIVGFTGPVDRQKSGRGYFTGICTDPEFERRGIATVLFNLLMSEFIKAGAEFSTLFTGIDNHAQKLYKRTGFRVVKTFAIMDKELKK